MSYILDALRKAAEQRDAQATALRRLVMPGTTSVPRRAATARGVMIGLAIGVASAIVIVVAFRPSRTVATKSLAATPSEPAVMQAVERPAADIVSPPAATPAVTPRPGPSAVVVPPRAAAPAPSVTAQGATVPGASPVATPPPVTAPPPVVAPAPPVAPVAPPITGVPPPVPAMPSAAEGVGGLRLEVVVYSDVPRDRMVFINGRKYVEGDTLGEATRVEEIKPDSVVLSEHGRRFTLQR